MSSDRIDDVVAEYLHEIEQRLHGLPVLQRRELLGDLEAHIVNERAERGVSSEAELLHVLERLGSPEVVAAAAYEEAGLPEPTVPLPAVSVGSAPMPSGAGPDAGGRVFAGTVTFASSSRFSGRAERTALVDTSEVAAMVAAAGAPAAAAAAPAPAPASVAPAPASVPPVWVPAAMPAPQPYAPPQPAAVIPPPDDLRRTRPGPFPPSGPGQGFRAPTSAPPPFVGGPPLAPPPLSRRPGTGTAPWVRALIAGAFALAFVVVLGCLGGAFLLSSDVPDSEPAVVVPQPASSVFPADPDEPPAGLDEQATETATEPPNEEPTEPPTQRPKEPARPTATE
ncbi:hypothetical protein AB0368_05480 [Actinoplanes sp. NPDC051475]|uniref:HAAS signaling domain-containing protein n=1 Tax=Actinoplanes sp. NPDC051475 TaxID=3157225 RepID=UPI00344B5771